MRHLAVLALLRVAVVTPLVQPPRRGASALRRRALRRDATQDANSMERAPRAPAALSRRRLLGGAAAACIGAAVLADEPARASYAPSSAAVTSTPPQKKLSIDELSRLGEKKAKQREGALGSPNIDTILGELEASVEALNRQTLDLEAQIEKSAKDALPSFFRPPPSKEQTQSQAALAELKRLVETEMKEREAMIADVRARRQEIQLQLERQRAFEAELKRRNAVLKKLDAQPEWVNYASAAAASVISTCVMHPVDTVKTKMQTKESAKAAAQQAVDDEVFDGKAAVLLRDEPGLLDDVSGLYKGLLGNVVKEAPSSALYLGVYEVCKTALLATAFGAANPLLVYLLAGGVGEFCGSIIRAPSEACKTMTQTGIADGFGDALASIVAEKSRRDQVLLAWSSSLYRDVPMGAIQIAIFEGLKTFILQSPDIVFDVNTLQAEAALGALGGAIGAYVTTPTDVITTRIISDASGATEGQSVLDLGRSIVEDGGPFALLDGAAQRVLYWAPAIGIFLSCYCSIRQYVAFHFTF